MRRRPRPRKPSRKGKRLLKLLLCGVLGGLVLAAAMLPLALAGGGVAKAGADTWQNLPTELATPRPAQTTYVYASDARTLITTFYDENRREVGLAQISTLMLQAVVAAEDTRFYQHRAASSARSCPTAAAARSRAPRR
jgi:membrane peptidoglycan carboxypeptidase